MKKFFSFMVLMAFGVSLTCHSQVNFGIKGALNMSNIRLSDDIGMKPVMQTGYAVGGIMQISFQGKVKVQPELLYSLKKVKFDVDAALGIPDATYNFSYLSVPVIAKYYIIPKANLQFGPQFDMLLSAKREISGMPSQDVKEELNSTDIGLVMGLGLDIAMGLGLDARYVLGLTDEIKKGVGSKSSLIQLGVFYKF